MEDTQSPKEQTEGIYSHVFIQNDDQDTSDEDDEASKPPKKFKSMVEIMENSQRVEIEEAAQTIEACHHAHEEPYTYDEACDNKEWIEAMNEELSIIEKNKTYELVDKSEKKNVISVK